MKNGKTTCQCFHFSYSKDKANFVVVFEECHCIFKGRVLLDPGWVSKYENSLNLNLIVPDGL